MRWSSDGRPARTWTGGVIATAAVMILAFAAHHPAFGAFLNPSRPAIGFDASNAVSAAWSIEPGSPLSDAGLRTGDMVLAANGLPVTRPLDLVATARDLEGRTLDLTVARPGPRGPGKEASPVAILDLKIPVRRDPAGCGNGSPCGWAGDLRGLFTPIKTSMPFETQVRIFAREIATVASMMVDPEIRSHSELRAGHEQGFRLWLDWLNFRMAAGSAITLTFSTLVLGLLLNQATSYWAWWRRRRRMEASDSLRAAEGIAR